VVDLRDDAVHAELGLGEQRHDQVDLVVAGGGDHDVAGLQPGRHQRVQLAGVGEQPLGGRDAVDLQRRGSAR
jgi:hypothetical protein